MGRAVETGYHMKIRKSDICSYPSPQQSCFYILLGLVRTVYIAVYGRIFGDFPAKNAVYKPYIHGSGQFYILCVQGTLCIATHFLLHTLCASYFVQATLCASYFVHCNILPSTYFVQATLCKVHHYNTLLCTYFVTGK